MFPHKQTVISQNFFTTRVLRLLYHTEGLLLFFSLSEILPVMSAGILVFPSLLGTAGAEITSSWPHHLNSSVCLWSGWIILALKLANFTKLLLVPRHKSLHPKCHLTWRIAVLIRMHPFQCCTATFLHYPTCITSKSLYYISTGRKKIQRKHLSKFSHKICSWKLPSITFSGPEHPLQKQHFRKLHNQGRFVLAHPESQDSDHPALGRSFSLL